MSYDQTDRFAVAETKTCIERDCGKEFEITVGEKEFFEGKNMFLPKRCRACRERKRQLAGQNQK